MIELLTQADQIREYRAILSAHISGLLNQSRSEVTVDDIEKLIFESDEARHPSEYFADLLAFFQPTDADLDHLLPLIQDAWNYFPHRSLHGLCPAEVMADLAGLSAARRRKPVRAKIRQRARH